MSEQEKIITQEERIKQLLSKYASFINQSHEEKIKIVRLCGILSYLEALKSQNMNIDGAIKQLENFLDKIILPYIGGDTNGKKT
jgi:hypothetical protein